MGTLFGCAVQTAREAAGGMPHRHHHHGGALSTGKGDQGPKAPYNGGGEILLVYSGDTANDPDLRISHIAIDRKHTTGEDPGTIFPCRIAPNRNRRAYRLSRPAISWRADQSQPSHDLSVDCPELVSRCKEDGADGALLVPNCPVCHQTISLAARMLEENGIATVVMGCAKDIVEYVGVPRFLFSDFPLGNSAGRPNDPASQDFTLDLALKLLERAPAARTTVQSPLRWSEDSGLETRLQQCRAAFG